MFIGSIRLEKPGSCDLNYLPSSIYRSVAVELSSLTMAQDTVNIKSTTIGVVAVPNPATGARYNLWPVGPVLIAPK